jgi:ribosomal protein S18 acetylase RimI-like enzyme
MNTSGKFQIEHFSREIHDLDTEEFPQPWNISHWNNLDYKHNRLYTFRSIEGELLAFALFGLMEGDDVAHLYKIITRSHLRGTLISMDFFKSILRELISKGYKSIYLEVEVNNKRAIRFYEKMGLKSLRLSKRFYSSGEDALIMTMML